MKIFGKTFLTLTALILGSLFISCSSDDDPTIQNPSITIDNAVNSEIAEGTAFTGKVVSTPDLQNVTFSYVKGNTSSTINSVTRFDDDNSYIFRIELANVTDDITGIKVSASNEDGGYSEKTLPVTVQTSTPLSSPVAFNLGYPSNNASNLPTERYGVSYLNNASAIEATFGGAFVMLTAAEYDAITTKEQLIAKYESGTKVLSFNVGSDSYFTSRYFISVEPSAYYLIEMRDLEFTAGDNIASFYMKQ